MKIKYWTKEERNIIRQFYKEHKDSRTGSGGLDLQVLSNQLGRSKIAICSMAKKLGLTNRYRPTGNYKEERYIVDEITNCWNWLLALSNKGYAVEGGSSTVGTRLVHIKYYEEKFGKVPVGLVLDHKCKNKKCVNPDHQEPVTHQENIRRAEINSKFKSDEIRRILRLNYKKGWTHEMIAAHFKVGRTTITAIISKQNHKDLVEIAMEELGLRKKESHHKLEQEELAKLEDK